MKHQIWKVAAVAGNETKVGEPMPKDEALAEANRLNDKPVDGTLHVARPIDMVVELGSAIDVLADLLGDEHAVKDINDVPLSILAERALDAVRSLTTRLECDRGFHGSGFASLGHTPAVMRIQ